MSDCSCIYVGEGDEDLLWSFKKENLQAPDECSECGLDLAAGQSVLVTRCYECFCDEPCGDPDTCKHPEERDLRATFYMCPGCEDLAGKFFCEGYQYTQSIPRMVEHINEDSSPCCFDGLSAEAIEVLDRAVWPKLAELIAEEAGQ